MTWVGASSQTSIVLVHTTYKLQVSQQANNGSADIIRALGTGAGILWEDKVNTVAADGLAPGVAKPSAAVVLIMW